ncbi:hypothetical protein O6H91_10G087100 [Diphasiastrum complanatum]|uniref:Uncharacterized protein n=1 Tax=Diphasiastrum complanatum TaxID=34168 RepID=A0ACC2CJ72_DIPCM|nr:hypothetical protein O6H91_10G087100 [Diphasiastrum complanatum]
MELDLEAYNSPQHKKTRGSLPSIVHEQLMTFLSFGGKKDVRRPKGNAAAAAGANILANFSSNARSKRRGTGYERLREQIPQRRSRSVSLSLRKLFRKKRSMTVKLGSSSKSSFWRFRVLPFRLKWIPPTRLLKCLRDAYVDMMISIASSDYIPGIARSQSWAYTNHCQ